MALGIATAFLTALACCIVLLKYRPKLKEKLYHGKTGKTLRTLHAALGFLLLATASLHLLTSWKLLRQRPLLTAITGAAMTVCILIAVISFLLCKRWGKWRVLHRIAAGLLLGLVALHFLSGVVGLSRYTAGVNAIEIADMSAEGIADGAYVGECDVGYIYAKVRVVVSGGAIADVAILEHRNERGGAAEAVTDAMVQEQDVHVDAVSGATNSSRVIMKAAENALKNAGGN